MLDGVSVAAINCEGPDPVQTTPAKQDWTHMLPRNVESSVLRLIQQSKTGTTCCKETLDPQCSEYFSKARQDPNVAKKH